VQGTPGAEFHPGLAWTKAQLVVRKGFRNPIDSYSAFFENDHTTPTGLAGYLRERGIGRSSWPALRLISASASPPSTPPAWAARQRRHGRLARIDLNGSLAQSERQMRDAGVTLTR
jgi:nicotinamidase/pyrazinamidase